MGRHKKNCRMGGDLRVRGSPYDEFLRGKDKKAGGNILGREPSYRRSRYFFKEKTKKELKKKRTEIGKIKVDLRGYCPRNFRVKGRVRREKKYGRG